MVTAGQPPQPEPVLPRIAAGDAHAVQECLDRYKNLIWWLARQMAGDEAEDAVQEIFIELWQNAARYDPDRSSEPAFVAMIARRRLIDRRRRIDRRPDLDPLEGQSSEISGTSGGAVEAVAEVSLAARALNRLKPEERRVVMMSIYHGLTHSEIADKTQLPLGTVKTYVRRGLIRVREMLAQGRLNPGEASA